MIEKQNSNKGKGKKKTNSNAKGKKVSKKKGKAKSAKKAKSKPKKYLLYEAFIRIMASGCLVMRSKANVSRQCIAETNDGCTSSLGRLEDNGNCKLPVYMRMLGAFLYSDLVSVDYWGEFVEYVCSMLKLSSWSKSSKVKASSTARSKVIVLLQIVCRHMNFKLVPLDGADGEDWSGAAPEPQSPKGSSPRTFTSKDHKDLL